MLAGVREEFGVDSGPRGDVGGAKNGFTGPRGAGDGVGWADERRGGLTY